MATRHIYQNSDHFSYFPGFDGFLFWSGVLESYDKAVGVCVCSTHADDEKYITFCGIMCVVQTWDNICVYVSKFMLWIKLMPFSKRLPNIFDFSFSHLVAGKYKQEILFYQRICWIISHTWVCVCLFVSFTVQWHKHPHQHMHSHPDSMKVM